MASTANPSDPDVWQLLYEDARSQFASHVADVENVRANAGRIMSAATVATAFISARLGIGQPNVSAWTIVAFAAFVLAMLSGMLTFWPTSVTTGLPESVVDRAKDGATLDEVHKDLATKAHERLNAQRRSLQVRRDYMLLAAALTIVEITAWAIDITLAAT